MTIMTIEQQRAFSRHECEKTDVVVEFNDWGIRIPSIPALPTDMRSCPFCNQSFFDMRRKRFENIAATMDVATPEEVAAAVADFAWRLERPGFPADGICSHFGPSVNVRGLRVNVLNRGPRLQVQLYQTHVYRPAELHWSRADAIARALTTSVLETWNGKDGADGISVVLRRNAPESVIRGIENYRAQPDVFKPVKSGWDAFEMWLKSDAESVR